MLISTLVSVILLMGLVLMVQSLSISSTKVLKRLAQEEERDMAQRAVRELIRPLLADAMINFDAAHSLKLNSTPYEAVFGGYTVTVIAQDVNGLVDIYRTPDARARALLPEGLYAVKQRMPELPKVGQPFVQSFVLAGGDLGNYPRPESWLTLRANDRWLSGSTLNARYEAFATHETLAGASQPFRVLLSID